MPGSFVTSSIGTQNTSPSSRAWIIWRLAHCVALFSLALFLLACSPPAKRSAVLSRPIPVAYSLTPFPASPVEQIVQYRASLIRENLPAYLDFVGAEVLPVMTNNIDDLLHNLRGLTEVRPGLFYHGHIDYSMSVPGEMDALMKMDNVLLQYHTLENPLIYIPYWREELSNIQDGNVLAWLKRIDEYQQAMSTPSAASAVQFTPLTEVEATQIASKWNDYRQQHEIASPGLEMLVNMVYLIDGGKQPLYQEAFKNIYKFHSIAFGPEGFLQLDNRTHLQNTFSPFQITFEYMGKCQELLPIFEQARITGFGYILNFENRYVAQAADAGSSPKWLHGEAGPQMVGLSEKLQRAISLLPADNLIKIGNAPGDQQIAFFAAGNYIFAIDGSLDAPSLFP